MKLKSSKCKNKSIAITNISSKSKNQNLSEEENNLKENKNKILQGKTLQVYWYILTHHNAGVREIQKALNMVSSGTVAYQLDKLMKAGVILKNNEDGKYYVKEDIKKGLLGFYFHLGRFMIPRYSLYLIINILGAVGYLFLAITYGDEFITSPESLLLLFYLIFSTVVFIYESIKIWQRKPT